MPNEPAHWDTEAAVCAELGSDDEAGKWQRRCLSIETLMASNGEVARTDERFARETREGAASDSVVAMADDISEATNALPHSGGISDPGGGDLTSRNFDAPDGGARAPAATDVDAQTAGASSLGAEGTPRTGETFAEGPASGGTEPMRAAGAP